MRYATNTKIERNQALYEYYLSHPDSSLSEMGKIFSITKERVRQIINREKLRRQQKATISNKTVA